MGSHGIRDQVAIVSMGCTSFGERWDQGFDDLAREAVGLATSSEGGPSLPDIDAFWLGTAQSAMSGISLARAIGVGDKPVLAGRELLRHRVRGAAPSGVRRRVGRLRRRHGGRRREGEGRWLPGPQRLPDPPRRNGPHPDRRCHVLDGRARVRRALQRRPRRAAPVAGAHRRQEPLQRRPQPASPVPPGDHRGGRVRGARGGRVRSPCSTALASPTVPPPLWSSEPRTPTDTPTHRST